MYLKFKSQKFI